MTFTKMQLYLAPLKVVCCMLLVTVVKIMYAKLPDKEQQAQYCNQENQQTAEPVHFFHNPKKASKSDSMKSILQYWGWYIM